MGIREAKKNIRGLRERFDAPYNSTDKELIEKLYLAVLGKSFMPTSCQNCYHDAVVEIYLHLKNFGTMAEKCQYRLKAGAIINASGFENGKIYTNENLTDEVAAAFLKKFPKQSFLFQEMPEETEVPEQGGEGGEGAGEGEGNQNPPKGKK